MRFEPQDTAQGPCWPRKPEFGGASGSVLASFQGRGPSPQSDI
jgi:hypothetical protein